MRVRTRGPRAWWRDLRAFDRERLDAAIAEFAVELETREAPGSEGWMAAANEHLRSARSCRDEGRIDGAWTLLKAAQRETISSFSETELLVEADRIRCEAAAKLTGWRACAVEDVLSGAGHRRGDGSVLRARVMDVLDEHSSGPADGRNALEARVRAVLTGEPRREKAVELDEWRVRVKEARRIVDVHSDNVYRRLHLLRGHLRRAGIVLVLVLLASWVAVAVAPRWGWSPTAGDVLADGPSFLLVMLLGALGASLSGVLTLLATDRHQRIPDVRAQRLLVWFRPVVGAAAAVIVVSVLLSGLAGVRVDPEAAAAVAFVAGFSEMLVSRAVAAASAAIVK